MYSTKPKVARCREMEMELQAGRRSSAFCLMNCVRCNLEHLLYIDAADKVMTVNAVANCR